ncbi:MAG: CHAT domain-containing tetratricopeptide repeat protein, partial [Saprospiraceae bacterium]
GQKHPEYVFVLANLASIYLKTGNYAQAERLLLQVNEIHANLYGKQHPLYVKAVLNLAELYAQMGHTAQSESLNLEAQAIYDHGLNKESGDYALVLSNLAAIYLDRGEPDQAEPLVFEAESVCAKVFGDQHPDHASALKNIGLLYLARGDYIQAERYYLQAHRINKNVLESDHPSCALTAGLLAQLYQSTSRFPEASHYFLESAAIQRLNIERAAGYSSELEMNRYLQKFQQNTAEVYTFAQTYPNSETAGEAFDDALFYKGFLLNTSLQIKNRANADAASTQLFETLRGYRIRLSEQYARPLSGRDSLLVADLEAGANGLEKELARTVVGYSDALRQVSWQEVRAALTPGEAAIEFIHYPGYNAQGKPTDSIRYAALVLRPEDKAPSFVPLFEERELEAWLQGISGGNYRRINRLYLPGAETQKTLNELIWSKLYPRLQGVHKVYGSLSGLLHRINLGAIRLNAKQTFANRYEWVVLGSTRQLVVPGAAKAYNREALLVGGVNYAENDAAIAGANQQLNATRGPANSDQAPFEIDSLARGDSWGYLPASVTEVLNLQRILQSARIQVALDTGYAATEESIKFYGNPVDQLSPRIVHFATHGYFFPDPQNSLSPAQARKEVAFKVSKNPLLRSGLIFAGAQQIWSSNQPPAGREDGVLTAQEISLMNLSGTELAVLSACETGLGDIDGNEGVYGLQRAFKIAGVKYLIMSLWKVNDQTTAEFMTRFYGQWMKKGLDIPHAFQNAQQYMQAKYPGDAYHWAGFVLVQ